MEHFIIVLLAILGLVTHFLKKVIEDRENNPTETLKNYYTKNPYQTAMSIAACVVGMLALWGTDDMTRTTAFMLGYMSDSAVAIIKKRTGL